GHGHAGPYARQAAVEQETRRGREIEGRAAVGPPGEELPGQRRELAGAGVLSEAQDAPEWLPGLGRSLVRGVEGTGDRVPEDHLVEVLAEHSERLQDREVLVVGADLVDQPPAAQP